MLYFLIFFIKINSLFVRLCHFIFKNISLNYFRLIQSIFILWIFWISCLLWNQVNFCCPFLPLKISKSRSDEEIRSSGLKWPWVITDLAMLSDANSFAIGIAFALFQKIQRFWKRVFSERDMVSPFVIKLRELYDNCNVDRFDSLVGPLLTKPTMKVAIFYCQWLMVKSKKIV